MSTIEQIMNSWEKVLNSDAELAERNRSTYSTIEGRTAIQLEVDKQPPYSVQVLDGKFKIKQGAGEQPLRTWKVPPDVFKDAMLGNHRLIFSLLDPKGTLSFDSPNFSHWNGATIIDMLLLAQEMTMTSPKFSKLVNELEC
jgi:hypothetical protein